jgi:hypothetical protein
MSPIIIAATTTRTICTDYASGAGIAEKLIQIELLNQESVE